MSKLKVGVVGWRGMVGSVLMQRMEEEGDFDVVDASFFSTSQVGQPGPEIGGGAPLGDAYDLEQLAAMDVILTSQGGDYTKQVHPQLRDNGWEGYWIDAASALRMSDDALLVLDPVNRSVIDEGLDAGIKDLIGSNCTVSTMLMGLTGLFNSGLVEHVISDTYQAASGAGAAAMQELLQQMKSVGSATDEMVNDPATGILAVDTATTEHLTGSDLPTEAIGAPLAGNVLPFIDVLREDGQSREEWKGMAETNKILGTDGMPVAGTCVRVGAMRSHAHALTIKLTQETPLEEIEEMIKGAHEWVRYVPNNKEDTINGLTSVSTSGSLEVAVGRLRKSVLGPEYIHAFTVGDQLLWGAAEPLRRVLRILAERV